MTSKSQLKGIHTQMDHDYKALAIKFAKGIYDRTTGYSFKKDLEEVDKSHCMECDAEVAGGDRTKLVHKDDCEVKEIQDFLVGHGVPLSRADD